MIKLDVQPPIRHKGNGQPKIEGKWFTRTSTLAKTLDDESGLRYWLAKMAMRGTAMDDGLRGMAATTDLADRGWRSLVDKAAERAGSGTAADTGTSIHTASEMLDYGQDVSGIPADILDDAKAYRVACEAAGLEPVAAEVFVANERLAVAGSFDRLVKCPDGKFRILDIKTVGTNKSPELAAKYSARAWSIQVSVYAGSRPYCAEQGYKDWTEVGLGQPETSGFNAIIAVIPRGSGTCSLLAVDLDAGAEMADLAVQVRKARKQSPARGWDIEKG